MAFDALCGLILIWAFWAIFAPKSFGREMKKWRDELAEGWNSPPQEKI